MLQALYNGLSGLLGFSKDLDNIGNNISNMNTPGYRGSSAFFENNVDNEGSGLSKEFTNTSEGDLEQTGTDTDAAIQGQGMFVLRDQNGTQYYTRSGHFQFNADGYLVDDNSGYKVAALNASGGLTDFSIMPYQTLPPVVTTAVKFTGNLAPGDTTQKVTGLQVYDASGGVHSLTATLTNNRTVTTGSWLVSVTDENGAVVGSGEIRFDPSGAITAGYTSMSLHLTYNGSTQAVALSFGTAGAFNGTTQITGAASSIGGKVADGHGVIGISSYAYDDAGNLQITYTDGETKQGPQLALADVADEQQLQLHEGAMYVAPPGLSVNYGKASDAKFGSITGGSLESSNVDLTTELTQMIIVQRGYQASSRVLTVTDAMLQQLYSATGGGGG